VTKILRRSPFFGQHVAHGASEYFDFAGWEMPTHFTSLAEEVRACREAAILFDGHAMGEVFIEGPDALAATQKLCANDVGRATPGQCVYSSLCKEDGGILDDLVVFCLAPDRYLLTVAAFNVYKTPDWIRRHTAGMRVCVADHSAGMTCLALQGPKSRAILEQVADIDVSNQALPYYRFVHGKVGGIDAIVARLGVTGELGYEVFCDPNYAWTLYDALWSAGKDQGLQLCGNRTIGMFRLEKVYHVYTRDIDETTNPYEAGLGRAVKLDKGDFIGREALRRISQQGPSRRLVGFDCGDQPKAVAPRTPIRIGGKVCGHATVCGFSPSLHRTIGLGYVAAGAAAPGVEIELEAESGPVSAAIVDTPFFDPAGQRLRG